MNNDILFTIGLGRVNLNDSGLSNETDRNPITMTTVLPLGSGGSGGSAGGIWGAGMTPGMTSGMTSGITSGMTAQQPSSVPTTWDMPWTGPPSGGGSTATYGPIYNPTAPPPSAAYGMTYPGYVQPHHPHSSSGSGSHRSNTRLMLAGSGSGSESASDGRGSSVMGSDKSSLLRNQPAIRPGGNRNQVTYTAIKNFLSLFSVGCKTTLIRRLCRRGRPSKKGTFARAVECLYIGGNLIYIRH